MTVVVAMRVPRLSAWSNIGAAARTLAEAAPARRDHRAINAVTLAASLAPRGVPG
jgi:hypothetical protein